VRNNYWAGNYQGCITEASKVSGLDSSAEIEKTAFVYRAYVELGNFAIVDAEVGAGSALPVRAVGAWSQYKQGRDKEAALAAIKGLLDDPVGAVNSVVRTVCATMYTCEGRVEEALEVLHGAAKRGDLEQMAMTVQIYLSMGRTDLAKRMSDRMAAMDDDCALTHAAGAWVALSQGGPKVAEAVLVFRELTDKWGSTALLLSALGAAHMQLGEWAEAEEVLLQALSKNGSDGNTLANLVVCAHHTGKPAEVAARYMAQLKVADPSHAAVSAAEESAQLYDALAASME
jgi:coatomer protein complex subunit epsilon